MRRIHWIGWKTFIILIVFLMTVVVFGTSFVMSIIEYKTGYAVMAVVSYFVVWLEIFGIEFYTNNYKFKYLFLGKNFKAQAESFFENHKEISNQEKKKILKNMKREYRISGMLNFSIYDYVISPKKLWYENFYAFSYGEAKDYQKEQYILGCLYTSSLHGGGFCSVFENLVKDMFSYAEYENLVKNSKLFSKELKKVLTKKEHKKLFSYYERYDDLSDDEHFEIQQFEKSDSNLLFEYQTEIFNLVERQMLDDFIKLKLEKSLPQKIENIFVSKKGTECVCVYQDGISKAYKISRAKFVFNQNDIPKIDCEGCWVYEEDSSFYETKELALKDIKLETKNFYQIK